MKILHAGPWERFASLSAQNGNLSLEPAGIVSHSGSEEWVMGRLDCNLAIGGLKAIWVFFKKGLRKLPNWLSVKLPIFTIFCINTKQIAYF